MMQIRKSYQKPKLNQVRLIPEEAVLTACKNLGGPGGKGNKCPNLSSGCKTTAGS